MTRELTVSPRDPIIARDGRPFGISQGARMKPLGWPYPSTVAGAVRTLLGKLEGTNFPPSTVAALKEVTVSGPLARKGNSLYFAAPRDTVLRETDQQLFCARPSAPGPGEGCDLPAGQPVCLPSSLREDFKPAKLPAFWSQKAILQWLLSPLGQGVDAPAEGEIIPAPEAEYRTHLKLDPDRGTAQESMLFQTAGLALPSDVELSVRVNAESFDGLLSTNLPLLHPLGGERRLVRWKAAGANLWPCPAEISKQVADARRVRMILATPGLFEHGWMPKWLADGNIPGTTIRIAFKGAVLERWKPVSGWSLERGRFGPKPVRRLVPAGSVYFFERTDPTDNTPLPLGDLWLNSVSDDSVNRRDGFGLALWGLWDEQL